MKKIIRIIDKCALHPNYYKMRLCCNHIDKGEQENIIILNNGDLLCQKCYNNIKLLTKNDLVFICDKCADDLISRYKKKLTELHLDINHYIIGLENLKEMYKMNE